MGQHQLLRNERRSTANGQHSVVPLCRWQTVEVRVSHVLPPNRAADASCVKHPQGIVVDDQCRSLGAAGLVALCGVALEDVVELLQQYLTADWVC